MALHKFMSLAPDVMLINIHVFQVFAYIPNKCYENMIARATTSTTTECTDNDIIDNDISQS